MGCCFSRASVGVQGQSRSRIPDEQHLPAKACSPVLFNTHVPNISSNGIPAPIEEETVKEVLSETPIAKPRSQRETEQNKRTGDPEFKPLSSSQKEGLVSQEGDEGVISFSEASYITELCSNMSESISMATTISEQKEDDEASSKLSGEIGRSTNRKIRMNRRPYAGDPSSGREQKGRYPTKRTGTFPEKNSGVNPNRKYAHGTESGEARIRKKLNAGVQQQSSSNHVRRSSSSSSPSTRKPKGTSKIGQSKNAAAIPTKVIGRAGDGEQPEIMMAEKASEEKPEKPLDGDGAIQPTNESIESPLVSLECFIFL